MILTFQQVRLVIHMVLETYIQEDIVHDQDTFSEWLHVYLNEQLVYSDGLACRLVYEALEEEDLEKVWKIRSNVNGSKFTA